MHPVFDADSHLMELPGWLEQYADADTRARLRPLALGAAGAMAEQAMAQSTARHAAGELLASDAEPAVVLQAKGWYAYGSMDPAERSRVLDALGFDAQLVFPTFAGSQFDGDDVDLLYGGTDALNRAMAAFCADDPRMLAVAVVPWAVPARTIDAVERAIDEGCAAIQFPTRPRKGAPGPTHPDHDRVWELLEGHGVPALTHIGGGNRKADAAMHDNGHPVTDFIGGGENVRSKDYLAISHTTEVFWGSLIFDGIFERFPGLRCASVEEGALWSVSWLRRIDMATAAFGRSEPRLANLPLLPSEYARRQLRFTPFVGEPIGWLVEQGGPDLYMFSSDYPHPEGSKDPVGRFERTMETMSDEDRRRFYAGNFAELFPARSLVAG
jgi:predicted TIM-barrel fold metal-dependent hydrolase